MGRGCVALLERQYYQYNILPHVSLHLVAVSAPHAAPA